MPFGAHLIHERTIKVSETNDEGSYARTTGNEATDRAGKGLQPGEVMSFSQNMLVTAVAAPSCMQRG